MAIYAVNILLCYRMHSKIYLTTGLSDDLAATQKTSVNSSDNCTSLMQKSLYVFRKKAANSIGPSTYALKFPTEIGPINKVYISYY